MKKIHNAFVGAAGFAIASALPAFAVDTSMTYRSSWLVLGFLGLFGAIVIMQMVPAIVMMIGLIKGVTAQQEVSVVKK